MAFYPGAENRNIPPGPNDPAIDPRIVVVHTMVGTIESADAHFRGGSGIEAHFGVAMDGRVWQWRDTAREADAQADGNRYCVSIETEDKGDPLRRWTAVQLQRLVELISWVGERHDVPLRLVSSVDDRGIGYHRQFDAWNPNHHSCPGDVRLGQLRDELIPALQGGAMPLTQAELDEIQNRAYLGAKKALNEGTGAGQVSWAGTNKAILATVQALVNEGRAQTSTLGTSISRVQDAVLGAIAALPTAHLSEADKAAVAAAVVRELRVNGVPVDVASILNALAARLAE